MNTIVTNENEKIKRKLERNKAIADGSRYILLTPLSVAFKVVSVITKIIGMVSAIGLPYGVYSIYMVVTQLNDGVPFMEATHRIPIGLFVILPFVALLVHVLTKKFSLYLYFKS